MIPPASHGFDSQKSYICGNVVFHATLVLNGTLFRKLACRAHVDCMHPVQAYGPTFVPPQPWLPIWADGVVPVTVLGGSGRMMLPISWWSRPWLPPKRKMCGPSQNVLSAKDTGVSG